MKPFPLPYRASLLVAFDLPQPAPARADDVSIGSESKLRPERSGRYWYADVMNVIRATRRRLSFVQPTGRQPVGNRAANGLPPGQRGRAAIRVCGGSTSRPLPGKLRGIANCHASDPWLDNPEFAAPRHEENPRDVGSARGHGPFGP